MYPETLYPKTKQILEKIKDEPFIEKFYLAGGTALALQLGHRKSIDIDLFIQDFPDIEILKQQISKFTPKIIQEAHGTLDVEIDGIKVSFLEYKYDLLDKFEDFLGVKLASVIDIGCMKLSAISSRGSKKDYVDLYNVLQSISLQKLFEAFDKKFKNITYQKTHILKSLVHFDDAEEDPDPDYIESIDWMDVKRSIANDVKSYLSILIK